MNLMEFLKQINDNDPIYKKKSIFILLFIIFLVVVLISLDTYRVGQVNKILKEKIYDMQISTISAEYAHNKKTLNNCDKTIAKKEDVEQIQNRLLKKMAGESLEISSISLLSPKDEKEKEKDSSEYEVVVNGQWENTMQFLNGLKNEPYIINLKSVRMEIIDKESRPILKSTFNYEIYFESEGVT